MKDQIFTSKWEGDIITNVSTWPRKWLLNQSLLFVLKAANLFLMDITISRHRYVHLFWGIKMNFVEPILDRKKIAQIKNSLRGQRRYRDLLLFVVGINTALRISDLLTLRIGLFVDEQKRRRHRFTIHERKQGKRHEVIINNSINDSFNEYVS